MLPKIPPACAVLGLRSPNPPKSSRKNNLHSLKPFAAPASDPDLGGLKKPISVRLVWMLEVYLQKGRQVVTPGAAALQNCFVKSLELDENYAMAWNGLGVVGGGTVKGQAYDEKDRRGAWGLSGFAASGRKWEAQAYNCPLSRLQSQPEAQSQ